MKIWQIDPANLTPYYNLSVSQALAKAEYNVRYITSKYLYDEDLVIPNSIHLDYQYFRGLEHRFLLRMRPLRQLLRGLSYPIDHWRVLQLIRKYRPDIVHMQWSRLPILDLMLIQQIQNLGIPVVHTVHDVVPLFSQRDVAQLANVYASVDALVLHTEANKKDFFEVYPKVAQNKVHILPMIAYPSPDELPMPANANQVEARKKLGIEADIPVILYFGAIKHYKGLDILAKAIEQISQEQSEFQFWIIGRPDSPEQSAILDTIKNFPNVKIHPKYIPSEKVWQYHLAADLIVFPYRHIFQSAALITAMSYGRAVIVTNVGGMPETIDGNGWIIEPENPEQLAETLIEAFENKAQLQKMGKRSRKIIMENHSPEAVAQHHINLYQTLLR